jgi:hypothetical protein
MARHRVIKPEFWEDEKLGTISIQARLVFIGIWTNSDDYGVVKGHPILLKNRIMPFDDIKKGEFEKWLAELESIKVITPFFHNKEKFYYINHFKDHQKVDKPSKSNYPSPPDDIIKMLATLSRDSLESESTLSRESLESESTLSRESIDEVEVEVEVEEKLSRRGRGRGREPAAPLSKNILEWSEYVKKTFSEILADEIWMSQQEANYPLVDIKKTIQEELDYWASDEGFEKRKGKMNCNWKSALCKAFKADWRCVPKSPDKKGKVQVSQRDALLDY